MAEEIIPLKRILELAKKEGKTLEQRALKLSEETGEVAEAVLSFTGAPSCSYKGLTEEDILQELIDVIIVASSCFERLSFSDDKIAEIFKYKIDKWEKKI